MSTVFADFYTGENMNELVLAVSYYWGTFIPAHEDFTYCDEATREYSFSVLQWIALVEIMSDDQFYGTVSVAESFGYFPRYPPKGEQHSVARCRDFFRARIQFSELYWVLIDKLFPKCRIVNLDLVAAFDLVVHPSTPSTSPSVVTDVCPYYYEFFRSRFLQCLDFLVGAFDKFIIEKVKNQGDPYFHCPWVPYLMFLGGWRTRSFVALLLVYKFAYERSYIRQRFQEMEPEWEIKDFFRPMTMKEDDVAERFGVSNWTPLDDWTFIASGFRTQFEHLEEGDDFNDPSTLADRLNGVYLSRVFTVFHRLVLETFSPSVWSDVFPKPSDESMPELDPKPVTSKCIRVVSIPWIDLSFDGNSSDYRFDIPFLESNWQFHLDTVRNFHEQRFTQLAPALALILFTFFHRLEIKRRIFDNDLPVFRHLMMLFAMLSGCPGRCRPYSGELSQRCYDMIPAIRITPQFMRTAIFPFRDVCKCCRDTVSSGVERPSHLRVVSTRRGITLTQGISLPHRDWNLCDWCDSQLGECSCFPIKPIKIRPGDLAPYEWMITRRNYYTGDDLPLLIEDGKKPVVFGAGETIHGVYLDELESQHASVPLPEFAVYDIFEIADPRGQIYTNTWNTLIGLPLSTSRPLDKVVLNLTSESDDSDVMESADELELSDSAGSMSDPE